MIGEIGKGLLVYLGIERGDQADDMSWVLKKLLGMRVFDDSEGKMNESLTRDEGVLLISQFTLFGNLKKGTRPSFNRAAAPIDGGKMFEEFLRQLRKYGCYRPVLVCLGFGSHRKTLLYLFLLNDIFPDYHIQFLHFLNSNQLLLHWGLSKIDNHLNY